MKRIFTLMFACLIMAATSVSFASTDVTEKSAVECVDVESYDSQTIIAACDFDYSAPLRFEDDYIVVTSEVVIIKYEEPSFNTIKPPSVMTSEMNISNKTINNVASNSTASIFTAMKTTLLHLPQLQLRFLEEERLM